MRLDKFLSRQNIGTRSQVKVYIRQGMVTVNGQPAKSGDLHIDEYTDRITFRDRELCYVPGRYYMLNKPVGVVSATKDNTAGTVVELLEIQDRSAIFPVGRLDKDTEGLLLLTDDGELAHRLLSPKRHVDKTYLVSLAHPISDEDAVKLKQGVDIGEKRPTLPAGVEIVDARNIRLTIHEGKFHQVKRMLRAVGNEVTSLKRISFGGLLLDESLKPGEYRELTKQEVAALHEA